MTREQFQGQPRVPTARKGPSKTCSDSAGRRETFLVLRAMTSAGPQCVGPPFHNYAEGCWLLCCLVVAMTTLSLARCPNIITTIQGRGRTPSGCVSAWGTASSCVHVLSRATFWVCMSPYAWVHARVRQIAWGLTTQAESWWLWVYLTPPSPFSCIRAYRGLEDMQALCTTMGTAFTHSLCSSKQTWREGGEMVKIWCLLNKMLLLQEMCPAPPSSLEASESYLWGWGQGEPLIGSLTWLSWLPAGALPAGAKSNCKQELLCFPWAPPPHSIPSPQEDREHSRCLAPS